MFPLKTAFALVGLTLMIPFVSYSQREWTSRRHKDGIEVFVKSQKDTDIKSYKAVSSTSATIEECVSFLLNLENHVNWRYSVTKVEALSSPGDQLIFYMIMDTPWPAEDRDIVIRVSRNQISSSKVEIILTAIDGYKERVNGFIRITNSVTTWTFHRLENRTEIVYQGIADPGGSLPEWLINVGLVDAPFETLKNFIKLVEN